jgi:hypothetical protein
MTKRFLLNLSPSIILRTSLLLVLLASCAPAPASPTVDMDAISTQAYQTALAAIQPTETPLPTETPVSSPTAVRTPPALPAGFVTNRLNPLDTPHTYVPDACQYLHDKWSSTNATPGTIVMVVMLHGIKKSASDVTANDITVEDFNQMMNDLKEQGFEAINATQMADFIDHNAKIPNRSVMLIQDDRRTAENFNEHFRPYHDKWGWPVVNSWISWDDSIRALNLQDNVNLEAEGWVDHQSHGYVHNINMTDQSTDEFIKGEFEGSLNDLKTNFNKTPVAIIWPGGGFGVRPVQFARQYGYRLGFTINPRGPVMFNWIPIADQPDPNRPAYLPEGYVNDPRMVIPRYWPYQVQSELDTVRNIGKEAAAYAEQNKATELEYYDIVCAPTLGQMP